MSSSKFQKVSYQTANSDLVVLGKENEKSYDKKDDNGKKTGEKGQYWNCDAKYKYDDGYAGNLILEGPPVKATLYYTKDRKTFTNDKGVTQTYGAKYSLRLIFEDDNQEAQKYIESTDKLRTGMIREFISAPRKMNTLCGYGDLGEVSDYNSKTFKKVCNHPKIKGTKQTDESKPKQEYLDAYDGTKFFVPVNDVDEKPTELNKDKLVEGEAVITLIPLVKYMRLHIGDQGMVIKKYLASAVVHKVEKRSSINYQQDTMVNKDVNVAKDIMDAFNDMTVSDKPVVEARDLTEKKDKTVEKEVVEKTVVVDDTPTEEGVLMGMTDFQ